MGCVLLYRYTKEQNINKLRQDSMYGYENNRNSPKMQVMLIILCLFNKLGTVFASKQSMWLDFVTIICKRIVSYLQRFYKNHGQLAKYNSILR